VCIVQSITYNLFGGKLNLLNLRSENPGCACVSDTVRRRIITSRSAHHTPPAPLLRLAAVTSLNDKHFTYDASFTAELGVLALLRPVTNAPST